MKPLLITALIVGALIPNSGNAQKSNWSTGIRIGARYDNLYLREFSKPTKINPEIGVYIKRKIYKRFTAEAGISYLNSKEQYPFTFWDSTGISHQDGTVHTSINVFVTNIGLTYNIIQSKKLELYTSAGTTNHHSSIKSKTKGSTNNYGWFTYNDPIKTRLFLTVYLGLGGNYNFNSHLYLNVNTRFETLSNPTNFELQGGPLFIPTTHVGVGYRF